MLSRIANDQKVFGNSAAEQTDQPWIGRTHAQDQILDIESIFITKAGRFGAPRKSATSGASGVFTRRASSMAGHEGTKRSAFFDEHRLPLYVTSILS